MSNLSDLVDFINDSGVIATITHPEIGVKAPPMPVLYAVSRGTDRLGVILNGEGYQIAPVYATVDEILRDGEAFIVRVDGGFNETSVRYEHAQGRFLEHWGEVAEASDDSIDDLVVEVKRGVLQIAKPTKPTKSFHFSRWSAFDVGRGKQIPYGVLMSVDGELKAFPFPGVEAENDASTFNGAKIELEGAGKIADQMTVISAPELVQAFDWEDARDRALYSYAKDYYAETNRSVYA